MANPRDWPVIGTPWGLVRGTAKTILVPSPAAGADWTVAVPGEGAWIVEAARGRFVASAAAVNRNVVWSYTDGQVEVWRGGFAFSLVANNDVIVQVGAGSVLEGSASLGFATGPWPVSRLLVPGVVFRVTTAGIDVNDQWSQVRIRVWELPIGPDGQPYWIRPLSEIDVLELAGQGR